MTTTTDRVFNRYGNVTDPIARGICVLMVQRDMRQSQLAYLLGLTPSGMSRALHRHGGLQPHLAKLKAVFDCDAADMVNAGKQVDWRAATIESGRVPSPEIAEQQDVIQPKEINLNDPVTLQALPPGCAVVRISDEIRTDWNNATHVLVAPAVQPPKEHDLVAWKREDVYWLYYYSLDAKYGKIVLIARSSSVRPVCLSEEDAAQLRVVLAVLDPSLCQT